MAQTLHPLFGEYLTDAGRAHSIPLPAGVYAGMNPTITGAGGSAGWTASLSPDADGFSYWRTPGSPSAGRYVIQEDAAVQVPIAAPDPTNPRIDLIIGIHKWVAGPTDPSTLEPTGQYTSAQQATYVVVKGTPAATPVAPVVADPYDGTGNRAVILAQVTVPPTGTPTVVAYPATDLRLLGMRAVVQEVITARSTFPDLNSRLNSLGGAITAITQNQINATSFWGSTAITSSVTTFSKVPMTKTTVFGTAVSDVDAATKTSISLLQPGLYEIEAFHKVEGSAAGTVACAIQAWLTRDGAPNQLIDNQLDTYSDEITEAIYGLVYVDPTWVNPAVYFERAGNPTGTMRGSVKYLGNPTNVGALVVANSASISLQAAAAETYPVSISLPLTTSNAVGAVTWSIVSGTGLLDGASSPAASIINGNQLQLTWSAAPAAFPATYSVEVSATDSAATPRTATKTLGITLNAAAPLAVTTATPIALSTYSYPLTATIQALATGGAPPYTWSIVSGGTTLPGAAVSGSTVTGTVSGPGSYNVELLCSDSQGTPAQATATIVINVNTNTGGGGGGGTGCVPAGTLLSLADGTTIPIETATVGLQAMAFDDLTGEPVEASITATWKHEDRELFWLVTDRGELICSHDHRLYSRAKDAWIPARNLQPGDVTLWLVEGRLTEATVARCESTGELATVYHLTLDHGHVYVAGDVPAHNIIKITSY